MHKYLQFFLTIRQRDGLVVGADAPLSGAVFMDDASWVAYCLELDISSMGATADEAVSNVVEAITLCLESIMEKNMLASALSVLDWIGILNDKLVQLRAINMSNEALSTFAFAPVKREGNVWRTTLTFGRAEPS